MISQESLNNAVLLQKEFEKEGKSQLLGQILVNLQLIDQITLDQIITEQIINLKSALEDSNHNLEKRVFERTKELEAAFEEINKLSKIKSNLISNISHELRTPITHIKGYLDLFASGDFGRFTDEQAKVIQILIGATDRLEKLIDELIMFTVGENEDINLAFIEFNILDTVKHTINKFKLKNPGRKINLISPLMDEMVLVRADKRKIEWVIDHLLENASKFSAPESPISLSLEINKGSVIFSIQDQGIGISENKITEIFESFHQLDGSSTRKYGGIGLGLALAQKILLAHSSKINVHSEIGVGSKFDFSLKRLIK
ncbi:MAG: sensor histidine kinase [Anaerolineaceae bacterium]